MIDSTLSATRVQGGWQLFTETGQTVKFTGPYYSCTPKNQNSATIKAAHIAMVMANAEMKRKHDTLQRKAKQR